MVITQLSMGRLRVGRFLRGREVWSRVGACVGGATAGAGMEVVMVLSCSNRDMVIYNNIERYF